MDLHNVLLQDRVMWVMVLLQTFNLVINKEIVVYYQITLIIQSTGKLERLVATYELNTQQSIINEKTLQLLFDQMMEEWSTDLETKTKIQQISEQHNQ